MTLTQEYKQRVEFAARRVGRELTPFVAAARSLTKQNTQLLNRQDRVIDQQGQLIDQQDQLIDLQTEANEMLSGLLATSQRIESQLINIGNRLEDVSVTLLAIHETLRTPTKTAAAELRDDALWALSRDLIEESEEMLERSLSVFQYDPVVHFYLGNIALLNDDAGKALTAYRLAKRYAATDMPALTAGAALRAAIAADAIGDRQDALVILFESVDAIGKGRCPAVHLAIASRNNDPEELSLAFVGDPTLLVDAAAREIPVIDAAADLAMASSWGPRFDRCSSALRYAEGVFTGEGVPVQSPPLPPIAPAGAARLSDTVVQLAWLKEQMRARIRQTPNQYGFAFGSFQVVSGEEGLRQQWYAYLDRWSATHPTGFEWEQKPPSRARMWMMATLLLDGVPEGALDNEFHFEIQRYLQPGEEFEGGKRQGVVPPGRAPAAIRGRNVIEAIFLFLNEEAEVGQPQYIPHYLDPDAWPAFEESLYIGGNMSEAFARLVSAANVAPSAKEAVLAVLRADYLMPW